MQRMFEDIDRLFGGGFGLHGDIGADGADGAGARADGPGARADGRGERPSAKPARGDRKVQRPAPPAHFAPPIDVFHRGDRLVIVADLPGVEKKDVRVTLEGATIVIAGERVARHEGKMVASERRLGSFKRRVPLPIGVDAKACDARMEDGLLEVTIALPRGERRDIEVQNGRLPKTNVFGGSSGPPSKPH